MKTFSILVLIILTSSGVFSQERDSSFFRFGFLVDYAGSLIDNVGAKYRCSSDFSIALRLGLSASDDNSNDLAYRPSQTGTNISIGAGIEYIMIHFDNVSFFTSLRAEFNSATSTSEYNGQSGLYTEHYSHRLLSLGPGIGVEYNISSRLSLSAHQWVKFNWATTQYSMDTRNPKITSKGLRFADPTLVLTFYL